jgi:hypothetical protein
MSDLIYYITMPLRWVTVGTWNDPSQVFVIAMIYASLGAYILTKKVSGARSVTAPVSFFVLFSCALVANHFLGQYHLPNTNDLQQIMIYTTAGVTAGALFVLITLRAASRGEG